MCANCPHKILVAPNDSTPSIQEFLYFVSGATANDLSDPFQGVCGVSINFKSDNIYQIEMCLISPGGDTIRLIGPDVGPGDQTALAKWNINFYRKGIMVFPDPGFGITYMPFGDFTNFDPWGAGGDYQGSYHPNQGNLDDFKSGPVNGPWRLVVKNHSEYNTGQFLDFTITFCDETGIECGCLAYAGLFPQPNLLEVCQGSSKLKLNLIPKFNGYKPDTSQYDYTYAIAKANNTIIKFDSMPDLRSFAAGTYKVCGFSYLTADTSKIPGADGILKLDSIYKEIASSNPAYCADLSKNCTIINILNPPPPYDLTKILCKDSCININKTLYCNPGMFVIKLTDKNGCDSTIMLHIIPAFPVTTQIIDTICKGEFANIGTNFYGNSGTYTASFKGINTCDSIVTLYLKVINIDIDIKNPDTLDCFHSSVLLDGFEKNGNGTIISYQWTASGGGIVKGNGNTEDLIVDVPGIYTLTATYNSVNGKMCSDSKTVSVIKNNLLPDISTIPDQFLCLGQDIDLSKLGIKDLSSLGGIFTFHSDTPATLLNIINPLVSPDSDSLFYVYYKAGSCDATQAINVFVNSNPQADVKDFVSVCNSSITGQSTSINFDTLVISGDKTGFWIDADLPPGVTGSFPLLNFTTVLPGTYQYVYSTQSAIPPCQDSSYVVNVIVENCGCPSVAIISPGTICNTISNIDLNSLVITTNPGNWTIIASPMGSTVQLNSTTLKINNSIGGVYTLKYTLSKPPSSGCDSFSTVDLILVSPPSALVTKSLTICNSNDMGQPTMLDFDKLVISGNKSGIWKDLSNSKATGLFPILDFKGIKTGSYIFSYTIQDLNSPCPESIYDVTITVIDCQCPTIEFIPGNICNINSVFDLNNTLKTPIPGSWQLQSVPTGSNPAKLNANLLTANNNDPGKYIFLFKLSSPVPGCPVDFTTSVNVLDKPFALVDSVITICNSDTNSHISAINLLSLVKQGDLGGTWEVITFSSAQGTLPLQDFKGVTPGSYYYKYVTNSAILPCPESEYIVRIIVENCECPSVSTLAPGSFCNDNATINLDQYKLTAEPGNWTIIKTPAGSNPAIISNNIFNGNNSDQGTYLIQFNLQNAPPPSCPLFSIQNLTIFNQNTAVLDSSFMVCNSKTEPGQTTQLDFDKIIKGGNTNGKWMEVTPSGATGSFPVLDFKDVAPGFYIYNYSLSANGVCPAMAYDITIEVISCICPPIFNGNPGIICNQNNSLDLTNYLGPNVTLILTSAPAGQSLNILNAHILTTLNVLQGNYVINGSVMSAPPFCKTSEDLTIGISDYRSAGKGSPELKICANIDSVIQLTELISSEEIGGNWSVFPSIPSDFDPLTGSLKTKNLKNGSYIFKYIQKNALPCNNDTSQQQITILNTPVADAGKDQQLGCQIQEVSLGGQNNPNLNNVDFNWTGGILSGYTEPNPVTSDTGIFYLKVTDVLTGCSNSDSVIVSGILANELKADFNTTNPGCNKKNGMISIQASGGITPYLYAINNKPFQSLNEFTDLGEGLYKIQVQDAFGCELDTNINILGSSSYQISLGADTTIYFGDSIKLTPLISISPNEIDSIMWNSLGYFSCTNCLETIVKPFKATLYTIRVFTKDGCILKAEKIVHVKKLINIYVPNVFSPNADGINDHLEVFTDQNVLIINEFLVFDRWGEKLFEARNINPATTNILWDGKFRGSTLNPGVYVYYLKARLIDGSDYELKGDFTLLK